MAEVRCSRCQTRYERTETKVPFRDSDHFKCLICGELIESWSGSRIPSFKMIEPLHE